MNRREMLQTAGLVAQFGRVYAQAQNPPKTK